MRNTQNYWRNTGNEPKFFMFDWRLSIFFLIIFLNPFKLWVYMLIFTVLPFFYYLNYKGYNIRNFLRAINVKIIGDKVNGKPFWFKRKYFG